MKEIELKSFDKRKINVKVWDNVVDARGVILIVHGSMEHSGNYYEFAENFNKKGYFGYAFDQRGFGEAVESVNQIGISKKVVKGEENMLIDSVKDIVKVVELIKKNHPGLPVSLVAQGLNCLLVQKCIEDYPDLVESVILLSPSFMKGIKWFSFKILSTILRKFKGDEATASLFEKFSISRWDKKAKKKNECWLSDNEEFTEKYFADEKCNKYPAYSYFNDMFKLSSNVLKKQNVKKINKRLPIQIIAGGKDFTTKKGATANKLNMFLISNEFFDTELKIFKDEKHYIINGINKEAVQKDLFKFLVSVGNKIERDKADAIVAEKKRQEEEKFAKDLENVKWEFSADEGIIKYKEGKKVGTYTLAKKQADSPSKEKKVKEEKVEQKQAEPKPVEKIAVENDPKVVQKKEEAKPVEKAETESKSQVAKTTDKPASKTNKPSSSSSNANKKPSSSTNKK